MARLSAISAAKPAPCPTGTIYSAPLLAWAASTVRSQAAMPSASSRAMPCSVHGAFGRTCRSSNRPARDHSVTFAIVLPMSITMAKPVVAEFWVRRLSLPFWLTLFCVCEPMLHVRN